MNNKINVLFLASWYPNELNPQSGNFIRKHAEAVSKYCNVTVIHVRARDQKEKFFENRSTGKGVSEYICFYKKHNKKIPVISTIIKIRQKIRAYKKTYNNLLNSGFKFDIVHVNVFLPAGVFALKLKQKYKIPFIVTEHWTKLLSISKNTFSLVEKIMIKRINKKASEICPVSHNLAEEMKRFGLKNNFTVVPNVVNTKIFFPVKDKKNHSKIRFLHISHLDDKHKNIRGILNVFKKLSLTGQNFILTVSGNRNVENAKKYASEIKFPKQNICFEGIKTEEEVADAMRNNDIFVMFSNYENLPVVISEAHATGIPVIASDVGGIPEMINNTNGILVKAGDEAMFLEKIIQMITNLSFYNKDVISEEAKKRYDYDNVGKKFHNIYKRILTVTI